MLHFQVLIVLLSCSLCWCDGHQSLEGITGDDITLSCDHPSAGNDFIQWYRQYPGRAPHFLLSALTGYKTKGMMTLTIAGDRKSSTLLLRGVQADASAVYVCAQASGYSKLIFGSGTKLLVKPKTERTEPSVYKLRAKNGDSDSVCLITDIPNPNTTVSMQDDEKTIDLNNISVLDSSSSNIWRYSAVVLENPSCNLQYDSKEITAKSDTDDDPETCTSMSLGEHFKTNPSLNSVSLTVFGLRILTAKAIIFNLILTVRLWSS